MVFGIICWYIWLNQHQHPMSRELTEFSDQIDEYFEVADADTENLWLFILSIFQ